MATGLTEAADLIVEDGTLVVDANSYNTIAFIDAYVNLRQDAVLSRWRNANEANKVAAAIIGTEYLDMRWAYGGDIVEAGDDVTLPQVLMWPRSDMFDARGVEIEEDEIPIILKNAHAEYAARSIVATTFAAGALLADSETQDPSGRFVTEKLKQIGPLKTHTKYSGSKGRQVFADYGNADRLIRMSGFLASSGETVFRA
jgi:hypothetical protein